jgi:hypothetical protein
MQNRPSVRQIFTTSHIPFEGHLEYLRPVGLVDFGAVWRSTDIKGWAISSDQLDFLKDRRWSLLAAARRSDAAWKNRSDDETSVWALTQKFHDFQGSLVVRWAMTSVVSLYADSLGELRDRAGRHKRMGQPVRQARELDRFLLGDGLDASSVASDIRALTADLKAFRWDVPEYSEDLSRFPQSAQGKREPPELLPLMRESLDQQAKRLLEDMATTTTNVGASAQLRQAIANTRLQRVVLVLSLAATAIALIGLFA